MDRSAGRPAERLSETLRRIDGRGYRAYKDIEGEYSCGDYDLIIDHVQGDPFAAPSRVRVRVGQGVTRMPPGAFSSRSRRVALSDFLARCFCAACRQSGLIAMAVPGQEILERNSVVVSEEGVGPSAGRSLGTEARFTVGLPAFGRRIAGREAADMLLTHLPRIVRSALCYESLDHEQLELHLDTAEDADTLRAAVLDRGCIAFVADGSILPRASGVDPRPLDAPSVVPFLSPE